MTADIVHSYTHIHTQEVESVMRDCEQLFKCKLEPVVAAAVRSWSLLLSIAPNSTISPLILRY